MYSLSVLLQELNVPFQRLGQKTDDHFQRVASIKKADKHSMIFIHKADENTKEILNRGSFSVVLLDEEWGRKFVDQLNCLNAAFFLVKQPRTAFAQILRRLYPQEDAFNKSIHPSAIIHPEAHIHPTVSIGRHCEIGKCSIGENSRIDAYTIVNDNVVIGKNVIIREYCLIGGCGFGIVRSVNGDLTRIPHIGGVIIEDDVEIFPHVSVDRATLDETIIKKGTKIDNYCHIGHNSTIGEQCIITAGSIFCGGSSIGNRSWVGVGSVIKEKVAIGDDVTIGLGSIVIGEVKSGTVAAGVPAKQIIKEDL